MHQAGAQSTASCAPPARATGTVPSWRLPYTGAARAGASLCAPLPPPPRPNRPAFGLHAQTTSSTGGNVYSFQKSASPVASLDSDEEKKVPPVRLPTTVRGCGRLPLDGTMGRGLELGADPMMSGVGGGGQAVSARLAAAAHG